MKVLMQEDFQVPGVTDQGLKPRRIRRAAIVGGGMMGSGIATNMILQQIPVLLKETDIDSLNRGIELIKGVFVGSIFLVLRNPSDI